MKIHKTPIQGAMLLELEPHLDERGIFTEGFVFGEATSKGLPFSIYQVNFSESAKAGTIRGMHWQDRSSPLGKIVYSAHGRIFDAIVDTRPDSGSFGMSYNTDLNPHLMALYVPPGVAHGWQALSEKAMLMYLVDGPWVPAAEQGIRYDDEQAGIKWPLPAVRVSKRDLEWPRFYEIFPVK